MLSGVTEPVAKDGQASPPPRSEHAAVATCAGTVGTSFASSPVSGTVATVGQVDCYVLTDVSLNDRVEVGLNSVGADPQLSLVDGNGITLCTGTSVQCALTGTGPWSLHVQGANSSTVSYSLAARRLTNPQGCSSLGDPDVWSFTAPRLNGSLPGVLDAKCYTFSRAAGEADGSDWFRTVRTSGTLNPGWQVYGPAGSNQCSGSSGGDYQRCQLLTSGQFALVVEDQNDTNTGSFFLTAKRITAPTGCAALPSIAFGVAPVTGNIANAGQIDCYTLPNVTSGDVVELAGTSISRGLLIDAGG